MVSNVEQVGEWTVPSPVFPLVLCKAGKLPDGGPSRETWKEAQAA
jgi:hypothetical protein